jgi:hypothetical protein
MNDTLIKIFSSREDISSYLFHFTKNSYAFETLCKIVANEAIKDVNSKGAICFTEAPITLLADMFKVFENFKEPMFSHYGIAIRKDLIFNLGGRPVIYGLEEEKKQLHQSMQWRFEYYIPNVHDYSWMREWRLPKSELQLTQENCFIITKEKSELSIIFDETDIGEIEFDGCMEDGEFRGYAYTQIHRKFMSISLEEIEEFNKLSKRELEMLLSKQSFDDKIDLCLGGF